MSALCANNGHRKTAAACPLGAPEPDIADDLLFNHLVGTAEQRRRDRDPQILAVLRLISNFVLVNSCTGDVALRMRPHGQRSRRPPQARLECARSLVTSSTQSRRPVSASWVVRGPRSYIGRNLYQVRALLRVASAQLNAIPTVGDWGDV